MGKLKSDKFVYWNSTQQQIGTKMDENQQYYAERSLMLIYTKTLCKDIEQTEVISEMKSLVTNIMMPISCFEVHQIYKMDSDMNKINKFIKCYYRI